LSSFEGKRQQPANQVPLRQLAQSLQLEELYSKWWQANWEVEVAIFLARRERLVVLGRTIRRHGREDGPARGRLTRQIPQR
jgi:hypothetical protein